MRVQWVVMLALCGAERAAAAATWVVPDDFPTVADAVTAAADGDVVEVGPGTWTGSVVATVDLSIVGTGGSAVTTLDGQDGLALSAGPGVALSVTGFTITAAAGTTRLAGAVAAFGDVVFTGSADIALVATNTELSLVACRFERNARHLDVDGGTLTSTDTTWGENGGIGAYLNNASSTITGGTVLADVYSQGGASTFVMSGTAIVDAFLFLDGGTLTGATVTGNAYIGADDLTITDTLFDGVLGIQGMALSGDSVVSGNVFRGCRTEYDLVDA
ncbi:MAG: hypothetical protein ABMB14_40685, partial [Myxococcota bacterium]